MVTKGRLEKHLDGPLHAADIESYTKVNLEHCSDLTVLQDERTASPGTASDRGCMDISSSSGSSGTVHFPEVSNTENQTSSIKSDRKDTAEGRRESSSSRKRKSRSVERPSGRPVRMRLQPDKLAPELKTGTKRARVATALACSIASGDGLPCLRWNL